MSSKKLLILVACLFISGALLADTLYVVVSNNLRGMNFSAAEIKHLLLGETTSVKNSRVHLIYPSYSSSAIIILSKFLGKGGSARKLKSYWSKMIFTGRGIPPDTVESEIELRRLLEENNSIGVSTQAAGMNVVFTIAE